MKNLFFLACYTCLLLGFTISNLITSDKFESKAASISSWQQLKEIVVNSLEPKKVNLEKVATIFSVDYQKKEVDEQSNSSTEEVVELKLIAIYESGNQRVARISNHQLAKDYKVGDELFGYVLTELTPKEIELSNGQETFTLKPFSSKTLEIKVILKEQKVANESV